MITFSLCLSAAALIAWLVLTWWNTPESVTFKAVVQRALRDVADVFEPVAAILACAGKRAWIFFGPRLTNLPTLAVIALDVYAVLTPDLREVIVADHWGAAALLALNISARLSPQRAPDRLPPAGPLVNNQAIA